LEKNNRNLGKFQTFEGNSTDFEIVRKFIGRVARQYANSREDYEDLVQIGHLGALKLLLECPDGVDPIEYVLRRLRHRMRSEARSLWRWKHRVELDADEKVYLVLEDGRTVAEFELAERWLDLERILTEEEIKLLRTLGYGMSQKKMAERLGVSPQAVNARVKRIRQRVGRAGGDTDDWDRSA
jgi:RNA polymerase sigma factor (sigma-70 family)